MRRNGIFLMLRFILFYNGRHTFLIRFISLGLLGAHLDTTLHFAQNATLALSGTHV